MHLLCIIVLHFTFNFERYFVECEIQRLAVTSFITLEASFYFVDFIISLEKLSITSAILRFFSYFWLFGCMMSLCFLFVLSAWSLLSFLNLWVNLFHFASHFSAICPPAAASSQKSMYFEIPEDYGFAYRTLGNPI